MDLIQSLIATPETDAQLREKYISKGREDRNKGLPMSSCPHDPNSIVGVWWEYGYNTPYGEPV